jgi:class 3 adenylate cyclase/PAS domain-containing protein
MFITRDRSYLYYVGYNISILGYVFALSGDATALFFPDASFQENLVLVTGILGLGFYVLFARSILELKTHYQKLNKVLRIVVIVAAAALVPTTLNWVHIAIPVCFSIALIAYPIIFALSFSLMMKKNVPATYFFIANSIYITLLMISILQMLGVLPTFIFGLQANVFVQIGVSFELALFSLGLGARIISIREKTLKESEERLSQFLEAMPVGVFVLDEKGHPRYTNKAANSLLRKEMNSDLDGNTLAEFYDTYKSGTDEVYPAEHMPVIKALQGESTSVEDMELRIGEKIVSLEVSATPIYDEKKNIISALAVFQDITQRLKAKKQLEEYNQTLEQKVQERTHEIMEQKDEIEREKEKADNLLLNILPAEVAQELKEFGKSDARLFQEVSVMFTDFVNFTSISEKLSPEKLVHELDYCFKKFDEIITKFELEKIKTIGDAYLSVCGLPLANANHAYLVVAAAVEILDFMKNYQKTCEAEGRPFFEIRIGIHSGPVVAGIVGVKKFAFDIWGDTVNTASRMESTSEPGKINVSGTTYELVKDQFACEYRGKINAKNKGDIDMYFVEKKAE